MIFQPKDKLKAMAYIDKLIDLGHNFEIIDKKQKRTLSQNDSIHLFCKWIATLYNDNGHTYKNPLGIETIWTMVMVKELIWRPLMISLLGKESTTNLLSNEVSLIADTIIDYFAGQGFEIEFPNMQSFLNKMDANQYSY